MAEGEQQMRYLQLQLKEIFGVGAPIQTGTLVMVLKYPDLFLYK
tara:strand:- start:49 stop:180 length:132 start_codon:yes stop_codon:yes gene_type:complete